MKVNQFSSLADRFAAQWRHSESGCWEWTGTCSSGGYGTIKNHYSTQLAHRTSWEIHFGPIATGMQVCHRCDNRRCVNPSHLFLGDAFANMGDAASKGRMPSGANHKNSKLTWDQVAEIRASKDDARVIAKRLGVSFSAVYRARRGDTYRRRA
jgi:hypothetical protein